MSTISVLLRGVWRPPTSLTVGAVSCLTEGSSSRQTNSAGRRRFGASRRSYVASTVRRDTLGRENEMGAIHCLSANAMPLPALAYEYQHPEDDDEPEQQISSSPQHMIESSLVNNTTSSRLRSSSLRGGGPSVTTMDGRINDHTSHGHPKSGGGGPGGPGGPGRHRCPRCESEVVFHSSDFNENSFYCAACSGWFVVQDHFASAGAGQASGAGPGQSLNKPSRNQILMQHIADLDDQIHAARRVHSVVRFDSFTTVLATEGTAPAPRSCGALASADAISRRSRHVAHGAVLWATRGALTKNIAIA